MNARKSLIVWIIACIIFAGAVVGFAHGAKLTDTDSLRGGIWMAGSLVVVALEVFLSYKLRK
jgi:hypothetical protein